MVLERIRDESVHYVYGSRAGVLFQIYPQLTLYKFFPDGILFFEMQKMPRVIKRETLLLFRAAEPPPRYPVSQG